MITNDFKIQANKEIRYLSVSSTFWDLDRKSIILLKYNGSYSSPNYKQGIVSASKEQSTSNYDPILKCPL